MSKDDSIEVLSYKEWMILLRRAGTKFQIGVGRGSATVIWLEKAMYNSIEEATSGGITYGKLIIDKIKHGKFSEGIFK